ncbi:C3h4 type zinc finger protein [Colletotrichum higginsianum]|nr:C3h4 type zinc finger protein [Colletotrichum higginsianum]
MDETMDYTYHHQEQAQGQGQLPFSQQRSRCPYYNRNEHHQQLPGIPQQHRSTMHYDPVHASAGHWHPQGQLPPYHWQHHMLGHHPQLVPQQQRSSSAVSDPHFYNHGSASSFGNGAGGYSGVAPNEMGGGPQTPTAGQPVFSPERPFGQNTASRNGAFNAASHSLNASTTPNTQDASEPSAEPTRPAQSATSESTGTLSQAPPPNSTGSIQFGSAPPSSAPQPYSTFPLRLIECIARLLQVR